MLLSMVLADVNNRREISMENFLIDWLVGWLINCNLQSQNK